MEEVASDNRKSFSFFQKGSISLSVIGLGVLLFSAIVLPLAGKLAQQRVTTQQKAEGGAVVALVPSDLSVPVGENVTLDIMIQNITGLYGAETRLSFDHTRIKVVDALVYQTGDQVHPGTFPNPRDGFVAVNSVDNATGTIIYAMTLLAPAAPVSGSGTFARITFQGIAGGSASVIFSSVSLLNDLTQPIAAATQNATITVTGASPAGGKPDLKILDPGITIKSYNPMIFEVPFENVGDSPAKEYYLEWWFDNISMWNQCDRGFSSASLSPNYPVKSELALSYTCSGTGGVFIPTVGEHKIKFKVDSKDDINEILEDNNEAEMTYVIGPPDLKVEAGSLLKSGELKVGSPLVFEAKVTNTSSTTAAPGFMVNWWIDGVPVHNNQLGLIGAGNYSNGLAANSSAYAGLDQTFWTLGEHTIRFMVDSTLVVNESSETNNEVMQTFIIVDPNATGTPPALTPTVTLGPTSAPTPRPTLTSTPMPVDKCPALPGQSAQVCTATRECTGWWECPSGSYCNSVDSYCGHGIQDANKQWNKGYCCPSASGVCRSETRAQRPASIEITAGEKTGSNILLSVTQKPYYYQSWDHCYNQTVKVVAKSGPKTGDICTAGTDLSFTAGGKDSDSDTKEGKTRSCNWNTTGWPDGTYRLEVYYTGHCDNCNDANPSLSSACCDSEAWGQAEVVLGATVDTPDCPKHNQGDAFPCDGIIDIKDFAIWRSEYLGNVDTENSDFSGDGMITLKDFGLWRKNAQ